MRASLGVERIGYCVFYGFKIGEEVDVWDAFLLEKVDIVFFQGEIRDVFAVVSGHILRVYLGFRGCEDEKELCAVTTQCVDKTLGLFNVSLGSDHSRIYIGIGVP